MKTHVDVAIIGGGPAGLAAAVACYDKGIKDILILERDMHLGGILQQCIHTGFGLHRFGEELTGPEYANIFIDQVEDRDIPYLLDTMVIEIRGDRKIYAMNSKQGLIEIEAKAIILAMGCRERTRGAIQIPGYRPAGVYTAGMAQLLVNLEGYLPGREIVILGSGDIGLIMARRLTWEGAHVKMVCELMPYSSGLARNIRQCLDDYDIPLLLNHTVVDIHGTNRVEGVTIARVDESKRPIPETEQYIECDTLLLSVGLLPENELSEGADVVLDEVTGGPIVDEYRHTNVEGIFACGNVLQVHDLVDYVSEEAEIAAEGVARYLRGYKSDIDISIIHGKGIQYTVPQTITSKDEDVEIFFRVNGIYEDGMIELTDGENVLGIKRYKHIVPGKMERIKIKKDMLEQLNANDNITIVWRQREDEVLDETHMHSVSTGM